jgi:pyruvate,water dikinase
MTPLTWSVVCFAIEDWVFIPGQPSVGNIGGRPYMNISVFASILYALGKDRQGFLDAMELVLYLSLPNDLEIPTISLSRLSLLRAIGTYLKVQYEQWRGWRRLETYLADNKQWFELVRKRIDSETSGPALADFFEKGMAPHIKAGAWSVLGCVSRSSVWMTRLRKDLTKLIGAEDAHYLIGNIGERSGFLASLAPMKGLSDIKEKGTTKEQYLKEYGHRGPEEFELSVPRPAEDPSWLERRLEDCAEHPVDIAKLVENQRDNYTRAWLHLISSQPSEAKSFDRRITRNAKLAGLREESRSAYVRDRWAVRLFALRAGTLTGLGDDIFFLTLQEVLMLLKETGDHTGFISERRACYEHFKSLPPYPSLIRGRFDPSVWAKDPERTPDLFDSFSTDLRSKTQVAETDAEDREVVRGSAGSAGVVQGRVRRLSHPDEGGQLQTGEILVTTATDIAWTLLFPRLAAVVTDVGAPLSHAAIVARELGIPAVVGCGNATARLRTGDLVLVDGSQGTVKLLEKAHD